MHDEPGRTVSIWMSEEVPQLPALSTGAHADVCVVGAGIAGVTTAYCLMKEGLSVILLDDSQPGRGMTERTTAHLSHAIDSGYVELERLHGRSGARLAAESHTAAIDWIEKTANEAGIACEFLRVNGYLCTASPDDTQRIKDEWMAVLRAGLTEVEHITEPVGPFSQSGSCLRFPHQAQFHPLKYLAGLVDAVRKRGCRAFSGAHVTKVESGKQARVETSQGCVVTADAVVVATNTPINNMVTIHTKQAAYITYVIGASLPAETIEQALWWDTEDPYHYVRTERRASPGGGEELLLIVGGEDQCDAVELRVSEPVPMQSGGDLIPDRSDRMRIDLADTTVSLITPA